MIYNFSIFIRTGKKNYFPLIKNLFLIVHYLSYSKILLSNYKLWSDDIWLMTVFYIFPDLSSRFFFPKTTWENIFFTCFPIFLTLFLFSFYSRAYVQIKPYRKPLIILTHPKRLMLSKKTIFTSEMLIRFH